jgi:hypothetical protein
VKKYFPRAVVIDHSKNHHYSIWVDRSRGMVRMACLECGDRGEVSIKELNWLRTLIGNDDDIQVICWIEDGADE